MRDHFVSPCEGDTIEQRQANMSEITPGQRVLFRTSTAAPILTFLLDFRDFWQLL